MSHSIVLDCVKMSVADAMEETVMLFVTMVFLTCPWHWLPVFNQTCLSILNSLVAVYYMPTCHFTWMLLHLRSTCSILDLSLDIGYCVCESPFSFIYCFIILCFARTAKYLQSAFLSEWYGYYSLWPFPNSFMPTIL